MKNSLRLLSVVLSLTAGAWCQNITASGSTCATTNACVSSQVTQAQGGATITLTGTFTATVQFEASVDGVTWKAIPSTDATPVTSATGTGVWQFNVAAYTTIRARCSAFTSGSVVVTINTSTASARSGGGGSGSGTVTHSVGPLTQYAVVLGNGSADTVALSSLGTTGQVLTSNGVGAAPSFQTGSGGVTSVGATSPVLSSGGATPTISISGVTALQGNAAKLQLATGTTTTGHFPSYDASGNLIDSTQPTGSSAGAANDVQIAGAGGTFAADTGVFTYNPSTHILNAGLGINTGSGGGVASMLGLSGGTTPASFPSNSFGWLGPSSATFTSYFLQCPTTPPTNGQTIVFGTQVGSVVPCTYSTPSGGGGNHNIDLMAGAAQLTAGCSINNSFLTNTAPTCLFQAGSATVPQQAFPQFTVAGTLGTLVTSATAMYIGPKTVPSDYVTNANIVLHFGAANPSDSTGGHTETFSVQYAVAHAPAAAQPSFTGTISTSTITVAGTVNNTATGTATISAPTLQAGDQVWFVVYLSAKTATDNPYLTQLYMSY